MIGSARHGREVVAPPPGLTPAPSASGESPRLGSQPAGPPALTTLLSGGVKQPPGVLRWSGGTGGRSPPSDGHGSPRTTRGWTA